MIRSVLENTKWITRIAWMAAALLPNSLDADFASLGGAANLVVEVQGWVLWAIVLIALWVLHPISLTVARMVAPLVVAEIAIGLGPLAWNPARIIAALLAAVTTVFIFTAEFGGEQVQAGVFGNERRYVLRIPAPLVLPTVLGWLFFAASAGLVPLVAVSTPWPIAVPVTIVALVIVWFVPQRLHQLSKRWLVRVPAGWVVHDSVLLADNILIHTYELVGMQVAPAESAALDITGLTRGSPLEISLREATTVRLTAFAARVLKTLDIVHAKALLVAPTRPRLPLGG